MENKEIFDAIHQDIEKYSKEGKIIKVFIDEPRIVSIEEICSQSTKGLLYDLDLDAAQLSCIYKDRPIKYANMMAIYNVIKFLHNFYLTNKDKND